LNDVQLISILGIFRGLEDLAMYNYLIVLALALLVAPIVLSIIALVLQSDLRRRLTRLEADYRDALARPMPPPERAEDEHEAPAPEPDVPEAAEVAEPPAAVPEPPVTRPAAAAAAAAQRKASLEQALGAKWSVWIGGAALALGAIFLVRFTIDQGLLTPGVRIVLGVILAAALCAVGEFLRRREPGMVLPQLGVPYIPGILTAAGIIAGYATIYAAYALYGFVGPLPAFAGLGLVSLAALALAGLHGPALAGLGLAGSFITPALVSSSAPSAWALFGYLGFVSAAGYATARLRGWLWLAISVTAGAVAWGFIWYAFQWQPADAIPTAIYMAVLALMATLFVTTKDEDYAPADVLSPGLAGLDLPAAAMLAAISTLGFALVRMADYSTFSLIIFTLLAAFYVNLAWTNRRLTVLAPFAAGLTALVYATWHFGHLAPPDTLGDVIKPFATFAVSDPAASRFLLWGLIAGAGFAGAGVWGLLKRHGDVLWTATACAAPLVLFVIAYWRITGFDHSVPFAALALGLALIAVYGCLYIDRAKQGTIWQVNTGLFAIAAISALALAFTIALDKGWLTLALALIVPGLAWVADKRPVPWLAETAAVVAAIVAVRLMLDPRIVGDYLGTTPIFNWLLAGYGVPALGFGWAAWRFGQTRRDWPVQILEAGAIALAVVLVNLQIKHAMNGGDIFTTRIGLDELALHSLTWLSFALGLNRLERRALTPVIHYGTTALGFAGLGVLAAGHLIMWNPVFTDASVGSGLVFNDLLLAYALPAILCGAVYATASPNRPRAYAVAAGLAALIMGFAWASLEIRLLHHGPQLGLARGVFDGESYTYSAVWLLFGLGLLGAGLRWRLAVLRYAALPILVLVTAKVFLMDMAQLTGLLRALSFIGLGLALVGIGWLYQKVIAAGAPGGDKIDAV
jgi:uncharacterized membrane protein